MQKSIMQGARTKWQSSAVDVKIILGMPIGMHTESIQISQPAKYLIISVNRLRYINNNVTKIVIPWPLYMVSIDSAPKLPEIITDRPCILIIILPLSIDINHYIATPANYGVWNDWNQNLIYCICSNIYWLRKGLWSRTGGGYFNHSHGNGSSSPSH